MDQFKNKPFREVMMVAQEIAANENLGTGEAVEVIITELTCAGYAIKRACKQVDYHKQIAVLYQSDEGLHSRQGRFAAMPQTQALASADLGGEAGWLVTWTENGLVRSAWFNGEGVSRLLTDYRVVNFVRPVSGANSNPTVSQQVA